MTKLKAGILGATGMVGQRFITLLDTHPWFSLEILAASSRSAGRTYAEAVGNRWNMSVPIPERLKTTVVMDAVADMKTIAGLVDIVFCAVDMPAAAVAAMEEAYARAGVRVISNNSAHRKTADVPMILPEINHEHAGVIQAQRKRLGTSKGYIAVKSNCSIQSYVPLLHPLIDLGLERVAVCTYQAISGAGKTFEMWPEMNDNVIPLIKGEDEKSEREPLKIWGTLEADGIIPAAKPVISAQCVRVPVSDGHMAAVFASFSKKIPHDEIISRWKSYSGRPQELKLPSAPKQFIHYFTEDDRPQTRLDRDLENGMAVSAGRLRGDSIFDVRFVGLSHNTLRGAAGGAVLMAELLTAEGY